ncbi:hypothetical protein PtB15_13B118 [Puccinia triticina]|nr:hypothetical protein PtB15_13B118 [Puccinia triticina]
MSAEHQQPATHSPEEIEAEDPSNPRLRSRTSTTTTTASTSNSKTDQPSAALNNSSLPSPVIPQPIPKPQKSSRGGTRKSNKSTRRSSLNQKKDTKKKSESTHSPPTLPNPPQPQEPIPEDDANITRCVCGEDSQSSSSSSKCFDLLSFVPLETRRLADEEANDVIMFQCDKCSVWQHGPCVGLYAEFPGDYFCEKCRPDLHTTGQYQKSTIHQPSRRSPSFTSSSSQRERLNLDVASLAAFLRGAGVKPEYQLPLGGFALPTFAQTRRQSTCWSMALRLSAPNDFHKTKHQRPSLDQIESPTLPSVEPTVEDQLKSPRISPAAELPAAPVSTTTSKLYNPPSASSLFSGLIGKHKPGRNVDDTDESGNTAVTSNNKSKAAGGFANQNLALLSEAWGLPGHLSYLDYLLPSPFPQPLVIEGLGDGPQSKIFETPARVKFPSKRITIADLRKCSKNLVDYLQKVQIESSDREKRNELVAKSLSSPKLWKSLPIYLDNCTIGK